MTGRPTRLTGLLSFPDRTSFRLIMLWCWAGVVEKVRERRMGLPAKPVRRDRMVWQSMVAALGGSVFEKST